MCRIPFGSGGKLDNKSNEDGHVTGNDIPGSHLSSSHSQMVGQQLSCPTRADVSISRVVLSGLMEVALVLDEIDEGIGVQDFGRHVVDCQMQRRFLLHVRHAATSASSSGNCFHFTRISL